MKKKFVILILLLCIAIASIGAVFAFGLQENKVLYEAETLYGDPSYAEDVTTSYHMTSVRNANWYLTYKFAKDGFNAEDDFKFIISADINSALYKYSYDESEPENINNHLMTYRVFGSAELEDRFCEEFRAEDIKGEVVKRVKLKDVQKYYVPDASIHANNMSTYGANYNLPEAEKSGEQHFWTKFYDYFKIPVIDEETLVVTGTRVNSNNGIACFIHSDYEAPVFEFDSRSVFADDALYFTFTNRISYPYEYEGDTKCADFSQVPGGYGIYKLPYNKEKDTEINFQDGVFDIDKLETIFSLDENLQVDYMGLSADGSHLYIITDGSTSESYIDADRCIEFRSINLKNFHEDQKYIIDENAAYNFVIQKNNFVVIKTAKKGGTEKNYEHLQVLYDRGKGLYDFVLDKDISDLEAEMWVIYTPQCACDGERFVLCNQRVLFDENGNASSEDVSTGMDLAVYEDNELKYYGRYTNSLDQCNMYNLYTRANYGGYPVLENSHSQGLINYFENGSQRGKCRMFNIINLNSRIKLQIGDN